MVKKKNHGVIIHLSSLFRCPPSGCCLQAEAGCQGCELKLPFEMPTEDQQQVGSSKSSFPTTLTRLFLFSGRAMNKTDAAAGKKKKHQPNKTSNGHFCCRKAQCLAHWEWSSHLQPSFPPASQESHAGAPKPLSGSVRSLLCRHRRTKVVSCEDEEFEVGCRSTPSSGGVWRNASWGYIKH